MAIPHSVNFSLTICKSKNMDNFKLDLTQLTPVEEKDRVKGNYYVAADDFSEHGTIRQWLSGNHSMHWRGGNGSEWALWFAIPPGLPGFPVAELPDEIKLPLNEWSYSYSNTHIVLHRTKRMPSLTIPSGTRAEQLAKLKEILTDFETF